MKRAYKNFAYKKMINGELGFPVSAGGR